MNGDELRKKRGTLGLTQSAFAAKLGVTPTFVGMLERGERVMLTTTEHAVWCLMYESKVAKIGDRPKPTRHRTKKTL